MFWTKLLHSPSLETLEFSDFSKTFDQPEYWRGYGDRNPYHSHFLPSEKQKPIKTSDNSYAGGEGTGWRTFEESTMNRTEDSTPGRWSRNMLTLSRAGPPVGRRRQRTMNLLDSKTSAVGAGPALCISQWPAPGYPNAGGARLATSVRRQGGTIVTGKAGFPEFLKLTAQQKAVRVTDSQQFEERDCRVGSPCGYGRRCIGAIQASRRVAKKTRAFHFSQRTGKLQTMKRRIQGAENGSSQRRIHKTTR